MHRRLLSSSAVLAGLIVAQIIAGAQVHISGRQLQQALMAISAAGYLPVPTHSIRPALGSLEAALCGGLFFCLSIGAGLSLATLGILWVRRHLFDNRRPVLIAIFLLWLLGLVGINADGVSWPATAYLLAVPLAVGLRLQHRGVTPGMRLEGRRRTLGHVVAVTLLALLWSTQFNADLFINIRDHLLLSNRAGTRINDFYYRYTLYPAEAFKSLHQKMLKTARIEGAENPLTKRSIANRLIEHDYLIVDRFPRPDLVVVQHKERLLLRHGRRTVVKSDLSAWLEHGGDLLQAFSQKCDQHHRLRQLTFVSLLLGFPLLLYAAFYLLCRALLLPIAGRTRAPILSMLLCVLIGAAPLALQATAVDNGIPKGQLGDIIAQGPWNRQLAGLKRICEIRGEIADIPDYRRLAHHSSVAVRYWFARALALSRNTDSLPVLMHMLADAHPNVVCQALYGLGRRGNASAAQTIIKTIQASDHWYVQWYGYNALKRLGWQQKKCI